MRTPGHSDYYITRLWGFFPPCAFTGFLWPRTRRKVGVPPRHPGSPPSLYCLLVGSDSSLPWGWECQLSARPPLMPPGLRETRGLRYFSPSGFHGWQGVAGKWKSWLSSGPPVTPHPWEGESILFLCGGRIPSPHMASMALPGGCRKSHLLWRPPREQVFITACEGTSLGSPLSLSWCVGHIFLKWRLARVEQLLSKSSLPCYTLSFCFGSLLGFLLSVLVGVTWWLASSDPSLGYIRQST